MKNLKYALILALMAFMASCGKSAEFKVMSFNVRYDNPEDSLNNWQYRKDVAAKTITENGIDIAGTQEVLHNQLLDLLDRMPEYNYVGVGRMDGDTDGEYSAVFYRKEKFEELSSGYFWLSETPEVPGSKGWDAACERIATWVFLKDISSGKDIFVLNTHMDHVGRVARVESVNLIVKKIKELSNGRPVVVMGDFNVGPESDVIAHITGESEGMPLLNSHVHAEQINRDAPGTFHGFGRLSPDQMEYIDYIFVSPDVRVKSYEVMPEKRDGIFVSDHAPVVAVIEVN